MNLDQYIIVRVAADQKNYTYWVVNSQPVPLEQPNSVRTTSASTLGTDIQNEMPTLAT